MREPSEHPYASFVHRVEKPARYLGGEFGSTVKDWDAARARVCLAFPDVYDIGMSHLGFKILYKILNDHPETLAERAYTPWVDMEAELRSRGLPLLSVDSARKLSEFDVVGFSLQFELTYTNILTMLDLGGIALRCEDRTNEAPLVIAGGPTATHPEALAVFIDAFVIGDGEERAPEVALLWTKLRDEGVDRATRLRKLAELPGVYVPSLYATTLDSDTGFTVVDRPLVEEAKLPIARTLVPDLNAYPFPDVSPVGGPEAIFDRMSIEIARGCTEGCRFCQAGMIYRPVRERDPAQIVETVTNAVKRTGYDEVSLTSLSTADYSCIAPLIRTVVDKLAPEKVSLGVSSLRAYGLDDNVLDDMQRVRAAGLTFAPEAGSQRMRDVVNKNVTEEQLMQTAERVFSRGYSSMKLYFMIGLPTEAEEDVREIPRVGGRARDIGRTIKKERFRQGPPKVTVSVSTHVPKPHTPFQWCAMDTPETVRQKQRWLLEEAKRASIDLRMHDSDTSWLEAVFARGDRTLGVVIERAYKAGARFDSWEDQKRMDVWIDAFRAEGIDVEKYLGTIPITARLPWDHIDVGLEEGFLAREYRKAVKSRLSPPCGKAAGAFVHHTNIAEAETDKRKLVCYDCGVACDLSAMRRERLVFLDRLGAKERRPAAELPAIKTHGKPRPPSIVQGAARRYRFAYSKLGASAFVSHLDLVRALPRAFRRLGLPLFYSQGFHPKPDMTFGPALSLGISSLAEVVDVKICTDIDPSSFIDALTEGSHGGLAFFGAAALGEQDAAVSRVINAAHYVVAIPKTLVASLGGDSWLDDRVNDLREREQAVVIRRIDKLARKVDVKTYLRSIELDTQHAHLSIAKARIAGNFRIIDLTVSIPGSGGVKVAEVLEAIAPELVAGGCHALRTELGIVSGGAILSPLLLEDVKRVLRSHRELTTTATP